MLQKSFYKSSLTALAMVSAMAFASASSAALVNGTFEADDASGGDVYCAAGWTCFESAFTNSTLGPSSGPVSHDAGGTQSVKMFGPFVPNGASGMYQAVDVVAGTPYTATVHAMNWAPDAFNNLGIFQMTFWDAPGGQDGGGNQIGIQELFVDPGDDGVNIYLPPQDGAEASDWTELSMTAVAPAGAVSAEIFLLHIQLGDTPLGGSLFWDDVSLTAVPVPAAVWLFGSGLLGLVGIARRRRS